MILVLFSSSIIATGGVVAASLSGPQRPPPLEPLVRVDQVLLARGLAVDGGERGGLQRLGEAELGGVVAGEGGLQLVGDALAQLGGLRRADLLDEVGEQPAAEAPGHAERAVELGGAGVEAAVDVDL